MPRISIVIPTHNRPDELARTLRDLGTIDSAPVFTFGGAEVIVVDNASARAPDVPTRLPNGLVVRSIRLDENRGAAGRNHGAEAALGEWLLMLDDDSAPLDGRFARVCDDAPDDVAAIGARITLPDGSRERGGLPEVVIGCGALIRRDAFLAAGGYDASFGYYAEEYDLCATLLLGGHRVSYDDRFRVLHRKVESGRDMGAILERITRNSAWVEERYAPEDRREEAVARVIERYGRIARKERAVEGWERAVAAFERSRDEQVRTPMSAPLYDRFTGLSHARAGIHAGGVLLEGATVALVGRAKQDWAVERAIEQCVPSARLIDDEHDASVLVVGTLSPGPMFDELNRRRGRDERVVLAPWIPGLPPMGMSQRGRLTIAA